MAYITLFLVFTKIGMFTIGGGQAMIPLIERDIVGRGWLKQEEFIDLLAVTNSLPGVFALNIAIFVGYKIRGIWGSIWCALGTILPAFFTMLSIAHFRKMFMSSKFSTGFALLSSPSFSFPASLLQKPCGCPVRNWFSPCWLHY